MKKNNPFSKETGHTIVVGKTGAGKTVFGTFISRMIFARSDITQLRQVYGSMSQDERDRLLRTIKANTPFRVNFKK